jgi:hypothetical protein
MAWIENGAKVYDEFASHSGGLGWRFIPNG